ncbi:histidine phosphatase family protein [Filibacter tadaridae]|uniref:Phosphoserine phosphatase 2 n=1 Tax=Filibacter tadaridae TaxID=2483811 RepID=A0A3P5WLG3_9BACL|nr:histidine phosphatase family protein [Filibacter tadaridae]VDC19385.1 Putative phosphoserine phosphatase 2 [Filibacter tadaridae]
MADSFVLHLVRHLPTQGNEDRKYIGWTDEPILESAKAVHPLALARFVCGSDLLRARQTAALYFPNERYKEDCNFRECNFGEFEGKTYADLEKDTDYRQWIDDPYANAPRGGESLVEVENRVMSALKMVPKDAIIVTHGGPIRIILTKFSPIQNEFWSWKIPRGYCYRLEWENQRAFKEGQACISISAVPTTANGTM